MSELAGTAIGFEQTELGVCVMFSMEGTFQSYEISNCQLAEKFQCEENQVLENLERRLSMQWKLKVHNGIVLSFDLFENNTVNRIA